jgi:FkbM family methyltransferase
MKDLEKLKINRTPVWDVNVDWDRLIDEMIINNHSKDWVYADVGSCLGRFTNLFINLSNSESVYAFDINNSIGGCVFENVAVSDKDGVEKVYDAGNSQMGNILGYDVGYNVNPFLKEIKSIRLDTYFLNKNVDCLKMDIEGSELLAIRGGIETIRKCSLVFIECHLDEDWLDIFNILEENGLEFYELGSNKRITKEYRPYQIYKLKNKK